MSPGESVTLACGSNITAVTNVHYPFFLQKIKDQVHITMICNTSNIYLWVISLPTRITTAMTYSGAQPEKKTNTVVCYYWKNTP
jgi:hypothetical protein